MRKMSEWSRTAFSDRFGSVRTGSDRFGSDRFGSDRFGSDEAFLSGADWAGVERCGPERSGPDRCRPERYGSDRFGPDRTGSVRRKGPRRHDSWGRVRNGRGGEPRAVVRERRARERHEGGDFDGEDLGRAGEGEDEHGGALRRAESLAKEKGAHVQVVAEDVEGMKDWG